MSATDDGQVPADDAGAAAISDAKPPSRRDAILRIGIVAAVLFVVFVVILPQFVDYQQVVEALQGLTLQESSGISSSVGCCSSGSASA